MLDLDHEMEPHPTLRRRTGGARADVFFVDETIPFSASTAGRFVEEVVLDIAHRARASVYLHEVRAEEAWHSDVEELAPIEVAPSSTIRATLKITKVREGTFDPAVLPEPWEIMNDD